MGKIKKKAVIMNRSVKRNIVTLMILMLVSGCKPKQLVSERLAIETSDSAVLSLNDSLSVMGSEIEMLSAEIERLRSKSINLSNEVFRYEAYYNTDALPDLKTGSYPLASEVFTSSNSWINKTINEYEVLLKEFEKEINTLTLRNSNLLYEVKALRDEGYNLETETESGFKLNYKLIIVIAIILFILYIVFSKSVA